MLSVFYLRHTFSTGYGEVVRDAAVSVRDEALKHLVDQEERVLRLEAPSNDHHLSVAGDTERMAGLELTEYRERACRSNTLNLSIFQTKISPSCACEFRCLDDLHHAAFLITELGTVYFTNDNNNNKKLLQVTPIRY